MQTSAAPRVESFYESVTGTYSHVVHDGERAAVVDAVLDYDPKAGRTSTASADRLVAFLREQRLAVEWILETHVHADHLSAAAYLKGKVGGRTAIGAAVREVQRRFRDIYHLGDGFPIDGTQFDHLLEDGETFRIGRLEARAMHVPGHTPADMAYVVGDAAFVGDTLFMPDVGTARADFPGGDAHALYRSIQRLLSLPPATRVFVCHDYPPQGRAPAFVSTVAEQAASNVHVAGRDEAAFVEFRKARDRTLAAPVLILPSIQVNIRAGALPPAEGNGVSYLKIPMNVL